MKLHRIAIAAGVLFGVCGGAFAQATATIMQSGSYGYATIDQNAPSGSVLDGYIVQRGGDNTARIVQGPDASGGAVEGSARIRQWETAESFADIKQTGTTAGTTAEVTQEYSGNNGSEIIQKNVSASTARAVQTAESSAVTIQQVEGSSSAYAEAQQVGHGWGSWIIITQGDNWFGGGTVTNSQARVFQNAEAGMAHLAQRYADNSSGYIAQGWSDHPGYYFSSLTNTWEEVDASVAGGGAIETGATLGQGGSYQTGYILQYGSYHEARVGQNGSNNVAGILQTGSGNYGQIDQGGSFNMASVRQYGNGGWAWLYQLGDNNTARITQR